jgi:hypothetical protein
MADKTYPANRVVAGTPTCTTLAGTPRMEIYPVGTLTEIEARDPINKLKNPSVIVMYTEATVTEHTAAVIEITRWQHFNPDPADNDPRIRWTVDNSLGGDVAFFRAKTTGKKVLVYGTKAGEVVLEAEYGGIYKAKFRALVAPLTQFRFRVSRLSTAAAGPRPSVGDIKKHIRIANIYLRQVGIKLVPDHSTDVASARGSPRAGYPELNHLIKNISRADVGFFEVELQDTDEGNLFVKIPGDPHIKARYRQNAVRINAVNEIINISYCAQLAPTSQTRVEDSNAQVLGACVLNPVNHGGDSITPLSKILVEDRSKHSTVPGPGVVVTSVVDNPGASQAGLMPNDVILEANRKPVNGSREFYETVRDSGIFEGHLVFTDSQGLRHEVDLPRLSPTKEAILGELSVVDLGIPSTSWVAPNGLPPCSLPADPKVDSHASSRRRNVTQLARHGNNDPTGIKQAVVVMKLFGCHYTYDAVRYVWASNGISAPHLTLQWGIVMDGQEHRLQEFGRALAHESCHLFGLRHRGGYEPGDHPIDAAADLDGVAWPLWENLMHPSAPVPDSQHLDILQAQAMRHSEMFYRPRAIDSGPEVEP